MKAETEYTVRTYRTEKAIITIQRPILTPEERERRMAEVKKAAIDLVISTEIAKRKKAQQCDRS